MNDSSWDNQNIDHKAEVAPDSQLSLPNVPDRYLELLRENGIVTNRELYQRVEEDPESILAIAGIGPKTFQTIQEDLESSSLEEEEEYHEPVQSLGDQFKSVDTIEHEEMEEAEEVESGEAYPIPVQSLADQFKGPISAEKSKGKAGKGKKDKKGKKKKKSKKKDKQSKQAKKKDKKSKKKGKKGKKSKKSDKQARKGKKSKKKGKKKKTGYSGFIIKPIP